jgi:hypothetical protein
VDRCHNWVLALLVPWTGKARRGERLEKVGHVGGSTGPLICFGLVVGLHDELTPIYFLIATGAGD